MNRMNRKCRRRFVWAEGLLMGFIIFTILAAGYDVRPIGPDGSQVGFASVNEYVFDRLGVHGGWYAFTEWLGAAAMLPALGFAATGLYQMIKRKGIRKVDAWILGLGAFYILMAAVYLFFEFAVINYRPVKLNGELEPSYPSTHVLFAGCILTTAAMQFHKLYPARKKMGWGVDVAAALMIGAIAVGRLLSGVHWFTDILGGLLLSAALIALYHTMIERRG